MKNYEIKKDKLNKIKYYTKTRKYNTALNLINEYIYEYPKDMYAKVYKAMIVGKKGNPEKEVEILGQLINENYKCNKQEELFALTEYARALKIINKYEESIYYYNLVINNSDDYEIQSRVDLSRIYTYLNDVDSALKVLTIDNYDHKFLAIERGLIYIIKSDYNSAKLALDKAKDLNNDDNDPKYSFLNQNYNYACGHLYLKLKNYDKAKQYLNLAVKDKSRIYYYKSYYDLATIGFKEDRIDYTIHICEFLIKDCASPYIVNKANNLLGSAYLKRNNPEKAKEYYSKCYNEFLSRDIGLARILIHESKFEEANKFIDDSLNNTNLNKNEYAIIEMKYYKLLTEIRLKHYLKANNLFDEIIKYNDKFPNNRQRELLRLKFYIDYNLKKKIDLNSLSYSESQIFNYNEKKALEHIKLHHRDDYKYSYFNDEINLDDLFNEIKNKLDSSEKICDGLFDGYFITYPNSGYDTSKNRLNLIKVITLPDTKKIITMYPFKKDNNIKNETKYNGYKVKKLSQIEKFNKKYNK